MSELKVGLPHHSSYDLPSEQITENSEWIPTSAAIGAKQSESELKKERKVVH